MPIFFEKEVAEDTKLGIWKIEEPASFFLQKVMPQRQVSHPHKQLQHLAGRYLLKFLFPDFPTELILIADTRKPFLPNEAYHFSISHCGNYAAAIVSKTKRVGIDIELPTHKVEKIKHKFLSAEEMQKAAYKISNEQQSTSVKLLTMLWSCKEAVFKWYGVGEVDFKEHIVVEKIKQISADIYQTEICFRKNNGQAVMIHNYFFEEIVLSFTLS